MTLRIILSVVDIVLLVAVLAIYLYWVSTLLNRIADNLEDASQSVKTIVSHAELIRPGVEHINRTGGVVAGALPLLYGAAEQIAAKVAAAKGAAGDGQIEERAHAAASGVGGRRSRLTEMVGYRPG